jgi:hypothetical protein
MEEKVGYSSSSGEAPPYDNNAERIIEDKGLRMGEAADVYGDVATAEEYGYVSRGYGASFISRIDRELTTVQAQVPSHSVYCARWNDRYRSFLVHRKGSDSIWSPFSTFGIRSYRYISFLYDAMSW